MHSDVHRYYSARRRGFDTDSVAAAISPRGAAKRIQLGGLLSVASLLTLNVACTTTQPDRAARMTRGYVYYLDGAGGGSAVHNWSGGVRTGFLAAGYDGAGEMFVWQTGLGVAADQNSPVGYKRAKAAELAQQIQQYSRSHPTAPVSLIGLSAGTAMAVFALEALPPDTSVENVILLASSLSADYDLTKALRHVRNRMYVFTSEKDAVLRFLVPLAGTADRERAVSAGLRGFQVPARPTADTREQYSKLAHIRWRPEFRQLGHTGGHTDAVSARFVQARIAPLIMRSPRQRPQTVLATSDDRVRNPDYDRWAQFPPGSWARFEGEQLINGVRTPIRIVSKLVSKRPEGLVLERTYSSLETSGRQILRVQQFFAVAFIARDEHPLTHPLAAITQERNQSLPLNGRLLACEVRSITVDAEFPEWGRGVACTLHGNTQIPGGIAKIHLESRKGDQPFVFSGKVVAWRAGSR